MDVSTQMLRVLQAIAERGSITAAAETLGYSQPTVSRQLAAAERQAGAVLFHRSTTGVRLTPAGSTLLRHATIVLNQLDAAAAELAGTHTRPPLRLGVFPTAGALLLPRVLGALADTGIVLTTREGMTATLIRGLRSGSLDAALISQRPPYRAVDTDTPALAVHPIRDEHLMIAVAATGPFGHRDTMTAHEATAQPWIAPPATGEAHLGVWPRLPGRPRIAHRVTDWLTRLTLVAAGAGITTIPGPTFAEQLPGVHAVDLTGVPAEPRRVSLITQPNPTSKDLHTLTHILREL